MSYWVAMVARNAASHIQGTIESLLHQTLKPRMIIVVDDGSNNGTEKVLLDYTRRFPKSFKVITLSDNGYDIRRVPSNVNLAWKKSIRSGLATRYFMISGDDCSYSRNYARLVVTRMNSDARIAVASGRSSTDLGPSQEHSPSGSGRLVRCSFWRKMGARYPIKAGWETWLLYKAKENGLRVELYPEPTFTHVRPRGAKHQFAYWGAAMYELGYHPLYALGRIAKNAVSRDTSIRGSMNMIRGYLMAKMGSADPFISPFDPALQEFIHRDQVERIRRIARSFGS